MTLSKRKELGQLCFGHESCQGLLQGSTGVITRVILMETIIVFPPVEGCSSNIFYLTLTFNCRKQVFHQWVKKFTQFLDSMSFSKNPTPCIYIMFCFTSNYSMMLPTLLHN